MRRDKGILMESFHFSWLRKYMKEHTLLHTQLLQSTRQGTCIRDGLCYDWNLRYLVGIFGHQNCCVVTSGFLAWVWASEAQCCLQFCHFICIWLLCEGTCVFLHVVSSAVMAIWEPWSDFAKQYSNATPVGFSPFCFESRRFSPSCSQCWRRSSANVYGLSILSGVMSPKPGVWPFSVAWLTYNMGLVQVQHGVVFTFWWVLWLSGPITDDGWWRKGTSEALPASARDSSLSRKDTESLSHLEVQRKHV